MVNYCINEKEMVMYEPNKNDYYISEKDIQYCDFLSYLSENGSDGWNNQLVIKQDVYNRFINSKDEDDEMDLKMIGCDNFFEEFQKITGINIREFERNFVSAEYIDRYMVNLIIKVDGRDERFIIDVV